MIELSKRWRAQYHGVAPAVHLVGAQGGRLGHVGALLGAGMIATLVSCRAAAEQPVSPTSPTAATEQAISAYREALDEPNRAQRLRRFATAAQLFVQVAKSQADNGHQPSADLWANAGNASLQAEELGRAILAYRRALQVDPRHQTAATNLRVARQQLPTHLQPALDNSIWSTLFFWNDVLAGKAAVSAGICFAAAALLFALAYRFERPMLRNLALVPALLWIGLSLSAYARSDSPDAAVIVDGDVTARTADSRNSPAQFPNPLPAGVEVKLLQTRLEWVQAQLPSGTSTWLPKSSVELVATS